MEKITVAICTWNRERLLEETLESLCRILPLGRMRWELVVVLNNCTDRSEAVVGQFRSRLPIVCAAEPRPGLSHARNRAIDVAAGETMIWIDDDVRVLPGWLRAYEQALVQWPQVSVFGGAIIPEFEGTPDPWLLRAWQLCDSAFAARRLPAADLPIAPDYPPYGANFAVRMPVQRQFRYDVRLGARPHVPHMTGEETEVIGAILASGGCGRWVRDAVVHHIMPRERQTVRHIRAYYQACGALAEQRSGLARGGAFRSHGVRRLAELLALEARFRVLHALSDPERWVPAMVAAATARGRWRAHGDVGDRDN